MFRIQEIPYGEQLYGRTDLSLLMPFASTIPFPFHKKSNYWRRTARNWFDGGISKDSVFTNKKGIPIEKAIKHIECLFNSRYTNNLEDIMVGVSFLLSEWFEEIII